MGPLSFFKKRKNERLIDNITDNESDELSFEPSHDTSPEETNKELTHKVEPSQPPVYKIIPENTKEQNQINWKELEEYNPRLDLETFSFPPTDLLQCDDRTLLDEDTESTKKEIIRILTSNKIEVHSANINVGYLNTLYEIEPQVGVRISRVKSLQEDLAFALLIPKVTIEPIPEKGCIGIIVPNKNVHTLPLYPLISSSEFQDSNFNLPLILGRNMKTENLIIDLTAQPHILIAGATGQGKSVLNVIIASLLYKNHPAELKMILVDTKTLEFNLYSKIAKHYLAQLPDMESPIITNVISALRVFQSLNLEMDLRYKLLLKANVRNKKEYNTKFKQRQLNPNEGHHYLPYLIVIIDEYFDLSVTSNENVTANLVNLTRKAHAVGIHIILSTQRPTKDIINGDLKAGFPVQIAFKVASAIDSRIIIDKSGAESLSGKGDALYANGFQTVRFQVPYISTQEIDILTSHIESQQGYPLTYLWPEYIQEVEEYEVDSRLDPLFEEAARLLVIHQQGSTSLIQRKFMIGYNRSGRIMEQLEKAGIVGPLEGAKARSVLIMDEKDLEIKLDKFLS